MAAFLLARLAEDERIATGALGHHAPRHQTNEPARAHIARHSPERVLREVAAKRRLIQLWRDNLRASAFDGQHSAVADLFDAAIIQLAVVHIDHPEFRASWLPHASTSGPSEARPNNVIRLHANRWHP